VIVSEVEIMVRMGELASAARSATALVSIGLGSCIGLALLDRGRCVAGLAHVMLPAAPPTGPGATPGKFADHALPALLQAVGARGARRSSLEAVLVGGARMFAAGATMDIGSRNEAATRTALEAAGIPVRAAATSGTAGRTIRVHVAEGVVTVRAAGGKAEPLFPARALTRAA
jgi:chemotaxis protein CheD